jgi:hypothetical protein
MLMEIQPALIHRALMTSGAEGEILDVALINPLVMRSERFHHGRM